MSKRKAYTFVMSAALLVSTSCVTRAKSKRMLHKRSYYKEKIQEAALVEFKNKNRRSFEVWMFPHDTADGYAFHGGWINLSRNKAKMASMQDLSKPLGFLQHME